MRKQVLLVGVLVTSAFGIHCAAPSIGDGVNDLAGTKPAAESGSRTPSGTDTSTPSSASAAQPKTAPTNAPPPPPPPAKSAPDAGASKSSGLGPSCQKLSTCCSKISNSLEQAGCMLAAGKANDLVCTAAMLTFDCNSLASAPAASGGPSCAALSSGALYCGDDGPGGDPNTLYRCTGSTISIARQCSNGCTTNLGVDDACANAGTPQTSAASCVGLSGSYCGTDAVHGNANTLYNCANDKVASSQVCNNGCVTNPDASLNDSCATSPPVSNGGGVSCSGLPDFDYCGASVNGDASTLYTCSGGAMTGSQACASGCTVASSNVSDYCSFSAGGSSGPDCSGLDDGTYCGSNGVSGDPDTLYTCQNHLVQAGSQFCGLGCFAGDFGGADSCN